MTAEVPAPVDLLEDLGGWQFPSPTNRRLQDLMDRNAEGMLTPAERDELEGLVELSETIALFRARALSALNRRTPSLEELLAGVTPENLHAEIDFGGPVGNEEW